MRVLKTVHVVAWTRPGGRRPSKWLPAAPCWFRIRLPNQRTLSLTWQPRVGIWLNAIWPRGDYFGRRAVVWPDMRAFVKKRAVRAEGVKPPKNIAPLETELLRDLLSIPEHCAVTAYDDDTSRRPGWVTIRTVGSAWQVEVKDPDTASRLVVTGPTLDEVLVLVDALLRAEEAPWEPDPWLAQAQARSKKK